MADQYLTALQVRARYGGIGENTLLRWRTDPALGFPQPEPIRNRNYWRVADLDAWDASRKTAGPSKARFVKSNGEIRAS